MALLLHDVTGPKQPEPHGCGVKGKRLTGIVPGLSVFHTVLPACSVSFLASKPGTAADL